jgi:carbonic anhydrase
VLLCGGAQLELLQFHFHTPSEHAFDGERAAMEVHLVHKNKVTGAAGNRIAGWSYWLRAGLFTFSCVRRPIEPFVHASAPSPSDIAPALPPPPRQGGLSVVGVLMEPTGAPNQALAAALKYAPAKAREEVDSPAAINPAMFLPRSGSMQYVRYSGSLTTPGCSEGVDW